MKKGSGFSNLKAFLFLVSFVFCFGAVFATIEITQPSGIYNFGDSLYLTVSLNPSVVEGSFEINVVCDNQTTNVYKISPAGGAFIQDEAQKINHKLTLTKEFIGNLSGDCYLESFLGKEYVSSSYFTLTDLINVDVKSDKSSYNPLDSLTWNVDATKANGILLNGYVDLNGIINETQQVVSGKASGSFAIPNGTAAGSYTIKFYVYDKDDKGVLNQKNISLNYEVNQVPTILTVSLSGSEVTPGEGFNFAADLFDQTNQKMNSALAVEYISADGKTNSMTMQAGETVKLDIAQNAAPGEYILDVSKGDLKVEKMFNVKELPLVTINFEPNSSVVVIKNVGNVGYNKPLNVSFGDTTQTLDLNLALGEEKKFNLEAPNGVYDVSASSGDSNVSSQVMLTGNAIAVKEWTGVGILEAYPFVWIFIVVILLAIALVVFFKYQKRTFKFEDRVSKVKVESLEDASRRIKMKKDYIDLSKPLVNEAQSNVAMKGSKDLCSVVAVSVKNHETLGPEGKKQLNDIITNAKGSNGVIDWRGSHALIIFSPLLTKTYSNELIAAKAAWKIKEGIDAYNKKFRDKISFNIGVNSGEMLSSLAGGKLNYTSLGNATVLAKRISDMDTDKLLVSAGFRKKLMRELKVVPYLNTLGDTQVFVVQKIGDVEANQDKLRDLLKRTSLT